MASRRVVGLFVLVAVLGGWAGVLAGPIAVPSMAVSVDAATPTPTPGVAGDTRSVGEGPGLVGAPLLAIGTVLLLGGLAALLTVAYVRLTGDRADRADLADHAGQADGAGRRDGPPETLP